MLSIVDIRVSPPSAECDLTHVCVRWDVYVADWWVRSPESLRDVLRAAAEAVAACDTDEVLADKLESDGFDVTE